MQTNEHCKEKLSPGFSWHNKYVEILVSEIDLLRYFGWSGISSSHYWSHFLMIIFSWPTNFIEKLLYVWLGSIEICIHIFFHVQFSICIKYLFFQHRSYTILGPQGLLGTSRQRSDVDWLWIYRCFYSPIFKMDVKKIQENDNVLLKKALVSTGRYQWTPTEQYCHNQFVLILQLVVRKH